MLTIPNDLQTFKDEVSDASLSSMNSSKSSLVDKLTSIQNSTTTAKSGVSTYYSSSNANKVISKFSKIIEIVSTIKSSLSSDLQPILDKASQLLDKIDRLEELNEEIDAAESTINYQNSLPVDSRDTAALSAAQTTRNNDRSEFNTVKSEARTMLRELKSMDANLDFVSTFTSTDYLAYLDALQFGTFERESYTASNGVRVDYYIYIPDYGTQNVEGLPVHIYMHGSGETGGSGTLNCGLPSLINSRSKTPEGIVICPQANEMRDYYQPEYQDAVIELTNKIIEQENADSNRVSISGHSMGAIAGYRMVARYPHYFAAFMPISGSCEVDINNLTDTAIWAIHGSSDGNIPASGASSTVRAVQRAGGNAFLTLLSMGHGGIQNYTFENELQYVDGEYYDPLTWCFRQTREA